MASEDDGVLTSAHVLEYPYSRSVGPVIGAFLTGLRDGRILGATRHGRRVIVPPTEYDPDTAEATGDTGGGGPRGHRRDLGLGGPTRRPQHPLDHPFAWVLVRLDGADTVDAARPRRRFARGRAAPACGCGPTSGRPASGSGRIQDIRAFVPAAAVGRPDRRRPMTEEAPAERAGPGDHPVHPHPARLHLQRRRGPVEEPPGPGRGQVHRPTLPGVPQGLRPLARLVPGGRGAHRRGGGAGQHRHGDHLLRGQRALRRPVRSRSPTSAPRCCWTGPTSPSWDSSRRSPPTRSGWACGWRRSGSPPEELGPTMASVQVLPADR